MELINSIVGVSILNECEEKVADSTGDGNVEYVPYLINDKSVASIVPILTIQAYTVAASWTW